MRYYETWAQSEYLKLERRWARRKAITDTVMVILGCIAVGMFLGAVLGCGALWAWGGWR